MKLIVGLGNAGKNYVGTKHNVGFEVIDLVAKAIGANVNKIKHKAMVGDGFIGGEKVILLKPQTFMNLSGESVKEAATFYKISIEDIVIIYDDISLPVGSTRIREKGSAGGHNGMKNIIAHLGTDNFIRIRVGIGAKPNGWDLADYVLSRFEKGDEPLILSGYERAAKAVEIIVKDGIQAAMNQTNMSAKADAKK
ncbi:MAG TPA: aminoacyl-tRNA hydrolase [Lachnospiraceae bacterium]|nr:aminoacyl-tRNA hydrolase [Lachnospiraceae bacterium]